VKAAEKMVALIEKVRSEGDSVGGVCELAAAGVPRGLGDPVFDKLKADLAKGIMSLPAVLGFEYGAGFAAARSRGSENNDLFRPPAPSPLGGESAQPTPPLLSTASNRHGGMLGGISSGMPLIMRAAVKPTSSLPREQPTVTRTGEPTIIRTRGRHDPCLLPRFVPMGEAMVLLVLADHVLRRRAQCPEMFERARGPKKPE
jgi:chorismate synthase